MSIFCSRKFSTPTKSREQCSIGGGGFSGHLRNSVPGDLRGERCIANVLMRDHAASKERGTLLHSYWHRR